MSLNLTTRDSTARIAMQGKFDFSTHRAFRQACDDALAADGVDTVHVDLCEVAYMDSSALGMLLLLRDKARNVKKSVRIGTKPGTVRDILGVANFQDLFAFE